MNELRLYADFETTVPILPVEYKSYHDWLENPLIDPRKKNFPQVYSWCLCFDKSYYEKVPHNFNFREYKGWMCVYGLNIKTFLEFITHCRIKIVVFFVNFGKFDGSYIMSELYRKMRFTQRTTDFEYGQYEYLANDRKLIFEIKLKSYHCSKDGNNYPVSIRDTVLLFPCSVKEMGESNYKTARQQGDTEHDLAYFSKKDLEGGYTRQIAYRSIAEFENDGNQLEYLFQDCWVEALFMTNMEKEVPIKKQHLTASSTSMASYFDIQGEVFMKRNPQMWKETKLRGGATAYLWKHGDKFVANKYGHSFTKAEIKQKLVNVIFPVKWLDQKWFDGVRNHIYLSHKHYKGGLVAVNERYRGKVVHNVIMYDINSAHPNSMYSEELYPVGTPRKGYDPTCSYFRYEIYIEKDLYNEDGFPFMYADDEFVFDNELKVHKRVPLRHLKEGMVFYIGSHEYKRFFEYYAKGDTSTFTANIQLSFKTATGRELFGGYVEHWYKIKQEASLKHDEAKKRAGKLHLNGFYGKNGEKIERPKVSFDDLSREWNIDVDDPEISDSKYYLMNAIVTTELTRMKLVDGVGHDGANWVYSDTDCLVWINDGIHFPHINIDPIDPLTNDYKGDIGYWKPEHEHPCDFISTTTKRYLMICPTCGWRKVSIGGGDKRKATTNKLVLDDFIYGFKSYGQLISEKLPMSILKPSKKEIPAMLEMKPMPEQLNFDFPNKHEKKQYAFYWLDRGEMSYLKVWR